MRLPRDSGASATRPAMAPTRRARTAHAAALLLLLASCAAPTEGAPGGGDARSRQGAEPLPAAAGWGSCGGLTGPGNADAPAATCPGNFSCVRRTQ